MSYKNPSIPVIAIPIGLDAVIQSLQQDLATLTWLDKSFGRAWEFKEKGADGKIIKVPKAYMGKGEYHNVLPNDNLKAQSFISVRGNERWDLDYTRASDNGLERDLSCIFWFNLKKIDPTKDYIFTELLKKDVEKVIKANKYVKLISNYYDERVEDVFDGYVDGSQGGAYSIDDHKTQYLMYPYSGFRFDFTVAYWEVCTNA